MDTPVSLIIPVLNEEVYIERCLTSLLRQENCNIIEVLVVDGGSTDDTVALVREMSSVRREIRLIHNPKRVQSAVFVRADAHMTYALDFTKRCVEALRENAGTIVVYMQTVGRSCFQRAVAAAQNSKMGNGGAAHRSEGRSSGWVDHGHHAAFDRAFFQRLGGYDATLSPE